MQISDNKISYHTDVHTLVDHDNVTDKDIHSERMAYEKHEER
jgi:hypothetical protein